MGVFLADKQDLLILSDHSQPDVTHIKAITHRLDTQIEIRIYIILIPINTVANTVSKPPPTESPQFNFCAVMCAIVLM